MIQQNRGRAGRWLCGAALLLALTAVPRAAADAPEWKVGLARVKITPQRPVFLEGYADRTKPFEKVVADLYAKAVVLEDRKGRRVAIVTSDLIGFPAALAEPVCARIGKKTGLKREQILLTVSHCHTAPRLGVDTSPREGMSAADWQRTLDYTRQLQDKVVEVVVRATSRLEPARLSWGAGVAHFVMNRREFTPQGVILGANPRGLADRTVPVLRVDTPAARPRVVLFGAAVHNTTLTGRSYDVCGDYAGFAQAYLEERYPSAQAMFILGCAGDADPWPRGTMALAREHGATLGKEVGRVLEGKLRPVRGPVEVALGYADLPLQKPPPRAELEKQATGQDEVQPWVAKHMLAVLDRGHKLPTRYRCPLAVWQFGTDLTLVALSGEVVVDYVPLIEEALGPNRLWIAAYSNDVFGYLPSAKVLRQGGYETRGLYAGGIGYFSPKAQGVVVDKVRELARQAGRQMPR